MRNFFNKLTEKRILLGLTLGSLFMVLGTIILVSIVKFSRFQLMAIGLVIPTFFILFSLLLYSAKKWVNNLTLFVLFTINYYLIYYFGIYQETNIAWGILLLTGIGLAAFPIKERDGVTSLMSDKVFSFFMIFLMHIIFSWWMSSLSEFFIEISKLA